MKNKENIWIFTLTFIQFFQVLDFVIMMPLAPVFMRELNINSTQFGLLVSAYNFAAAPSALLIGMIIDRFDRKKFNIFALITFIIATILCGFARNYEEFLIARILTGIFAGMLSVSILSILASLIPPERRGRATGIVMSAFSFSSVIGIPIGLSIAQNYGWRVSFIGIGVLSIVPFLLSLFTFPNMSDHVNSKNKDNAFKKYFSILKNPEYFLGISIVALVTLSSFLMIPFLANLFVKNLNIPESKLSFVYFFGGGATILSSWAIGILSDRFGGLKCFRVGAILSFIPMLIISHMSPQSLSVTLCMTTLFMCLVASRFIPCMSVVTKLPSAEDRGGFMSLMNSFRSLATAVSTFLGGVFLIEGSQGKYENFHHLVYASMGIILIVLFLAGRLKED